MSHKQFSILEKVEAIKAILTVAKAVQTKRPDAPVNQVIDAIELAVLKKLDGLRQKPFASLDAKQVATLGVLETARTVMGDVLAILGDEETTRMLDDSERTAIEALRAARAAKAKPKVEAKTAPKKGTAKAVADKGTADMFAKA